jgi:hypothetical protein
MCASSIWRRTWEPPESDRASEEAVAKASILWISGREKIDVESSWKGPGQVQETTEFQRGS